jgi:hypothetical protein
MTVLAFGHFDEVRMEWPIVTFELAAAIFIVVLRVVLPVYRVIHGIRIYFSVRGTILGSKLKAKPHGIVWRSGGSLSN